MARTIKDVKPWAFSEGDLRARIKRFSETAEGQIVWSASSGGGGGTITALNNKAANRLVTIGSTTTELDGEANLTYDGTTFTVNDDMKVGADGSGHDVTFYSATSGDHFVWDASEEKLTITGTDGTTALDIADGNVSITDDLSVDGTTNLDNTDIDGTFAVDGTTISLDATTSLNIDNSNTSNGITIGTATSGVPISIGHSTSETTINDNLTVTGDLTVNGATTTYNTTTMTVDDPIITLGGDSAPGSDDNKDRGVEFRWHDGSAAKIGFFGFDDSTGYFTFIPKATNSSEVFSVAAGASKGTLDIGALISAGNISGSGKGYFEKDVEIADDIKVSGSATIGSGASNTFVINSAGRVSGSARPLSAIFEGNVETADNFAASGSVTAGSGVVVGSDADGTDRTITFGHSTIKSVIGIDDSGDVFAINTDDAFEATNDFQIDASGHVTLGNGNLIIGADADGTDRTITFGHSTLKTTIGIDDSGDVFAINTDNAFETANDFQIDASGHITLGNGNLVVGADADGTDRTITFGHSTLKTTIGIDDDQDVFAINTDGSFEAGNDLEINASGDVTLANGDLYVDKIRRASDSGTTTKILLNDEVIKLYAGHSSDEVVNVSSGVIAVAGNISGSGKGYFEKDVEIADDLKVTGSSTFMGNVSGSTAQFARLTASAGYFANLHVSGSTIYLGGTAINESEIATIDSVTAGTVAASKAVVVDSNKDASGFRNITGAGAITAGTSFIIGSADLNEADMEKLDGITDGTVAANKAVVVDSNKDAASFRNLTATGAVTAGSFVIGSANISEAELETIDGVTAGTAAASKAVVLDGSKNIATIGTIGCGAITSTGNSSFAQVTTSGRVVVDDTTEATSTTDGSLQTDGGLSVAKDIIAGDDIKLLSNSAVLSLGADSDASLTHDGTTGVTLAANPITLDSGGDINLDADGGDIIFKDGGTEIGRFTNSSNDFVVHSAVSNQDMLFKGNDGGSTITALTLDMSEAGNATFNGSITCATSLTIGSAAMSEADLEKLDGITNGTVAANKAVVVDGNLDAGSFRNLTATGAITGGSFVIGSADISEAELETIDGVTAGTVAASKAVVVDSNKDVASFRNLTATGAVTAGSFVIGSADISEAELETIDGITAGTVAASKAVVVDSNKDATGFRNVTGTGAITAGTSFIIGSADLNETDLEKLDGITNGTAAANKAVVLDGNADVTGIRNLTMTGDLTVQGTTTTVDTVTMQAANAVVFEGATADAHETTLTIVDPDADNTIYLPNAAGYIPLLADATTDAAAAVTAAEYALLDGGSTVNNSITVADGDGVLFNDGGTMKHVDVRALSAYFDDEITAMPNLVSVSTITTGVWNAGAVTSSGIIKSDDTTEATTTTDGSLQTDGGLSVAKSAVVGDDLDLLSDSCVVNFGADKDITLTHTADTGLTMAGSHANGTNLKINNSATDGDARIEYQLGGTTAWSMGVEDGDSDKFVIEDGAGALGADPAFEIAADKSAKFYGTLEATTSFTIGSAALTEAELEMLDGITAGTVAASKAVVVDSNKDISGFRNFTSTGKLSSSYTSTNHLAGDLVIEKQLHVSGSLIPAWPNPVNDAASIPDNRDTRWPGPLDIAEGASLSIGEGSRVKVVDWAEF